MRIDDRNVRMGDIIAFDWKDSNNNIQTGIAEIDNKDSSAKYIWNGCPDGYNRFYVYAFIPMDEWIKTNNCTNVRFATDNEFKFYIKNKYGKIQKALGELVDFNNRKIRNMFNWFITKSSDVMIEEENKNIKNEEKHNTIEISTKDIIDNNDLEFLGENIQYQIAKILSEDEVYFKEWNDKINPNYFIDPSLKLYIKCKREYYKKYNHVGNYDIIQVIMFQKAHSDLEREVYQNAIERIKKTEIKDTRVIKDVANKFFRVKSLMNVVKQTTSNNDPDMPF